jgi:hypothetical protein
MNAEILKSLLTYDPDIGIFAWKPRDRKYFVSDHSYKVWITRFCGRNVVNPNSEGYLQIMLNKKMYSAHRLAWLYATGSWPTDKIDHINGDRADNRIINLRSVDSVENTRNKALGKNNKSGHFGVYWNKQVNKWTANIQVNGRVNHLGTYTDKNEAIAARKNGERKHGFHENHGRCSA